MRCGRSGPDTSTPSISFEKVFPAMETPIAAFALSRSEGRSLKRTTVSRNPRSFHADSDLVWLGRIARDAVTIDVLRRITSVAELVQRLSFVGKGIPEMASKKELFHEYWLPQTTSCCRATYCEMH